jgi:hypothetical protein
MSMKGRNFPILGVNVAAMALSLDAGAWDSVASKPAKTSTAALSSPDYPFDSYGVKAACAALFAVGFALHGAGCRDPDEPREGRRYYRDDGICRSVRAVRGPGRERDRMVGAWWVLRFGPGVRATRMGGVWM